MFKKKNNNENVLHTTKLYFTVGTFLNVYHNQN